MGETDLFGKKLFVLDRNTLCHITSNYLYQEHFHIDIIIYKSLSLDIETL